MLLGTEICSNNTRVMVILLRGFTSVYMLIREALKKTKKKTVKSFTQLYPRAGQALIWGGRHTAETTSNFGCQGYGYKGSWPNDDFLYIMYLVVQCMTEYD